MARGTQFQELVQRLRAELSRSTNVAVGVEDLDNLKETINRVYQMLVLDYDWPHLRKIFDRVPLVSGQRYYDLPDGLHPERVERAAIWYSNLPHEIRRGISFEEYAGFNSHAGIASEPALMWDLRWMDTKEQIEIWPVPSGSAQELEFIGIQNVPRMVNNSDVCVLDDDLVTMFAAAELATRSKHPDAQLKLQAAQQHYTRLRGRSKPTDKRVRVGLGPSDSTIKSGRAIIRVR